MNLMDTAGQEAYENIRRLSYRETKCFILCFSVVDKITFKNLTEGTWLTELREEAPGAKILLVGTKSDLRGQKQGRTHTSIRNKEVSLYLAGSSYREACA